VVRVLVIGFGRDKHGRPRVTVLADHRHIDLTEGDELVIETEGVRTADAATEPQHVRGGNCPHPLCKADREAGPDPDPLL